MIHVARPADAAAIVRFLAEFRAEGLETVLRHEHLPTLTEQEEFLAAHDGERGIALVAGAEGRVVGFLNATRHRHAQLAHGAELGMGVLAGWRGRGIGGQLLDELEQWAAPRVRRLELSVLAGNVRAIALYRRKGFVEEGIRRGTVRDGSRFHDVVEMAKLLSEA